MNKRVAIVVAVLVIVGGSAAAVSVFQLYGTEFHYEAHLANDSISSFRVFLENMADCNLTIGFVDDPSLTYSLDVTLYKPGSPGSAFTVELREWQEPTYWLLLNDDISDKRIKSVNLLLGSTINYTIHVISSTNLNSTIIFSNNAYLPDWSIGFEYDATGVLRLGINESVRVDQSFNAWIRSDLAIVFIDLPDDVNGEIAFSYLTDYLIADIDGWYFRGDYTYTTEVQGAAPLIDVLVEASAAVVVLYD